MYTYFFFLEDQKSKYQSTEETPATDKPLFDIGPDTVGIRTQEIYAQNIEFFRP